MTDPRIPSEVEKALDDHEDVLNAYENDSGRACLADVRESRAALVQAIADALEQARADERRSMMAAYALSRNIVL